VGVPEGWLPANQFAPSLEELLVETNRFSETPIKVFDEGLTITSSQSTPLVDLNIEVAADDVDAKKYVPLKNTLVATILEGLEAIDQVSPLDEYRIEPPPT
jgi:hypothetical protein